MNKRIAVFLVIVLTVCFTIVMIPGKSAFAVNDWPYMKMAIKYEEQKDYTNALVYWAKLVELYESDTNDTNWTNCAIYWGKIGDYYAGKFDNGVIDRPKAVEAYDKCYEAYKKANINWGFIQAKRKADELRTTIKVFMERSSDAVTSKSISLGKFEPAAGMYIGVYGEKDEQLVTEGYVDTDRIKECFGKNHSILLFYSTWGVTPFPTHYAETLKKTGGALQIAMQPTKGLNAVVDGKYIRDYARDANSSGIPVFLRFGGEMNGEWVEWYGNPKLFIEKFRMIHDIMEKEAPNVAMVWAPNDFPWDNMEEYYPGDKYVDWVGVSSYSVPGGDGNTKLSNVNVNPIDKLQYIYEKYSTRKPVMIAEGAISYYSSVDPKTNFVPWCENNLKRLYLEIPRVYPRIKAICYFDQEKEWNKYTLNEQPEVLKTYNQIIKGSYYLDTVNKSSPVYYREINKGSLPREKVKISSYVKIYEPNISKVEYYIDNVKVCSTSEIPYEFEYDFSKKGLSKFELTVKAYDSKGILTGTKTYNLDMGKPTVKINGEVVDFDDIPPQIIQGSVMVPIRRIFEKLGAEVKWDDETETALAVKGDVQIEMKVGNNTGYKNGMPMQKMPVPVTRCEGRLLVPVRFISEALGYKVDWIDDTKEVLITN